MGEPLWILFMADFNSSSLVVWGFNCAHPISANGIMYLKSCTWWWDYKSRVATSLKLFISHVIALLPPGYLNSLLYLSLRMKSSHLKIITASSVLCPEMTTHFSPSLLLSMAEKAQTHLLWDPDTEKLFILRNLLGPTNSCIVFH